MDHQIQRRQSVLRQAKGLAQHALAADTHDGVAHFAANGQTQPGFGANRTGARQWGGTDEPHDAQRPARDGNAAPMNRLELARVRQTHGLRKSFGGVAARHKAILRGA